MAYLGEDIPKLGFGLMRLPRVDGKMENPIDMAQLEAMVDLFLENGFCYFDTAFGYQGSEEAIGKALVQRYPRESFRLATKLPAWAGAKTKEEAQGMFQTSLERTGAGYFDFYLLHNVSEGHRWAFDQYEIWDYTAKLKQEGLVKHVGFSFHDHAAYLDKVLNDHPEMEFVQLQVNYADWDDPVVESRACMEVAAAHGKPVVIMEPLRGGKLCNLPESVSHFLTEADPDKSLASWGLRFAAGLPNVITVLSGMSTLEQMPQNLEIMQTTNRLNDDECQALGLAQVAISELDRVPCTDCRYCIPYCPANIPIPGIFDAYNNYLTYNDLPSALFSYGFTTVGGPKGSDCVKCGQCESVCTQHIDIRNQLAKATELLEKEGFVL